ncbi:MAG: hypothetical protein M3198_15780 [Actinomycetota bacterium]|nr:hypothetical protein [Actinomycetota bacterium]
MGCLFLAGVLVLRIYYVQVLNTRLPNLRLLLALGFYVLVAGILLFALAMVRAGVLNRWASLLFLVSIPLGLAIDRFSIFTGRISLDPGLRSGIKLLGVALIWLGYSILSSKPAERAPRRVGPAAPKSSA